MEQIKILVVDDESRKQETGWKRWIFFMRIKGSA